MKQAEIISLLSLPCFRFDRENCSFGRLECQENQVRFVERDRIFSISFYKIENIEFRNVEGQPQLIFLTHVGLIIFYFYENTPLSHIRYIHDAILGAFVAYKRQTYVHPIWSGRLSTWNQRTVLIWVYDSVIVMQTDTDTRRYGTESIQDWMFTKYTLTMQDNDQKLTLRGSDVHILQHLTQAMLDGSIQGMWHSTGFLQLTHQYVVVSNSHVYIHTISWKNRNVIQIEIRHIHTVKHTSKGIEIESLTNPISAFALPPSHTHIFHNICNTIVKQKHPEYVFLWRKKTLLRGTLIETAQNLIIETHQDTFQWAWNSLCRDDDEDSRPQILALRNGDKPIRIHLSLNHSSSQEFYKRHTLPHRRITWKDLSHSAKRRIFTNRIVHIQSSTCVVQIVAYMERLDSLLKIYPISIFPLQQSEIEVTVHFHTDNGQYHFNSLLVQTNSQLFITNPDQISLTSQRHAPRYRSNKKVIYSLLTLDKKTNRLSSTSETFAARLINISEGGAGVITSMELLQSQKVLLDIDDYPQQIICVVRHCILQADDEYKVGLQFCSLSNQSRKNINEMLQIFVKERH